MKDASRHNINSGTTATVVLLADSQIIVANLGDSKAFLCSEVYQSPSEAKGYTSLALSSIENQSTSLCWYKLAVES